MNAPQRQRFLTIGICAVLILLTGIAYFNVLHYPFITYDDRGYVTRNLAVQQGLTFETIKWAFTATAEANWHPLTWLSHALDYSLFGLQPGYHHAVSLIIHLLNTALLFLVFKRMTGKLWESAFVAAVFGLHPLHVESVAWIAERKDVLSGLFWILTMGAYVQYCSSKKPYQYAAVLIFFTLGLLAKPMLVTLPFVLLLLDYWPLRRISQHPAKADKHQAVHNITLRKALVEKIPLFMLTLASSIITFYAQQQGGATKASADVTLPNRIGNALLSYGMYLRKTFLPYDLSIFYPHPGNSLPFVSVLVSIAALASITFLVLKYRKAFPPLLTGWLWYAGTLVPVIGILQVGFQAMADRYMYLPQIGISVMLAWGVPLLVERLRIPRQVLAIILGISVLLMLAGTMIQVGYWQNSRVLFEHANKVTENNFVADNNLATELADSGLHESAIPFLERAIAAKPEYYEAHHNLARSLLALGKRKEALEQYQWILARVPNDPALFQLIAELHAAEGNDEEALRNYKQSILLNPADMYSLLKAADLLAIRDNLDEAEQLCRKAMTFSAGNPEIYRLLGIIEAKRGNTEAAERNFITALRYDSTDADIYYDFAIFYERTADLTKAMEYYRTALRLNPKHWNAYINLGILFARQGEHASAEQCWLQAIAGNPLATDARINLGKLYLMQKKYSEAETQFKAVMKTDPGNRTAQAGLQQLPPSR